MKTIFKCESCNQWNMKIPSSVGFDCDYCDYINGKVPASLGHLNWWEFYK